MKNKITVLSLITLFGLTGCTAEVQTSFQSASPTASPNAAATTSPSPTTTATPAPTASAKATNKASSTPTQSPKSEVNSATTVNSQTNININSNGTSVKITSKNGKRYAELNGKEVELDANGCYDYDQSGTKIHSCVN
jgi:hypothetical protein